MDGVVQIRAIYDKAGGKWEALTAEDKATYLKSFGGKEADGRRMWDTMAGTSAPQAPAPPQAPSAP